MKKIILMSVLVFAIFSCKNGSESPHEKMIERIDNLGLSEKIYEVEINDKGEKGDTISIKSIKRDENGKKVYEKSVRYQSGWQSEVYYNDNEDEFLRKSENGSNVQTTQEHFFMEDTLLKETLIVVSDDGETDSSIVNYEYAYYPNGKVMEMKFSLNEGPDSSLYFTYFNEAGQRTSGLQMQGQDTLYQFESFFDNGKLIKTRFGFKNRDQVDYFDENEKRIKSDVFTFSGDSLDLTRVLTYTYDEDGNMLSQTIWHAAWDQTKRIEYFKVDIE